MSLQEALDRAADTFLENTNVVYSECSEGVARLDRIIVSVHAELAGWTRTSLIPSLYAYWERFFTNALGEYLRALSTVGVACKDSHESLRRLRIRRELQDLGEFFGINQFHEMADKLSPREIQLLFEGSGRWLDESLEFPNPERWVETDNNVRFAVLERNLKRLALSCEPIKAHFASGRSLYALLEKLVNDRNAIAHGQAFDETSSETWNELRQFVEMLLNALQLYLYESLRKEASIVDHTASSCAVRSFSVGSYAFGKLK
jgi:hypothetical protein